MERKKSEFKLIKYMMYLLITVCAFFVFGFNSKSVEAAPTVSIPTDSDFNYDNGITYYVGYDFFPITELKYKFGNGSWVSVSVDSYTNIYKDSKAKNLANSVSYINTSTSTIAEYHISSSNLPSGSNGNIDSTGKFKFTVYSKNKSLGTNETTKSTTLTYDGTAPKISKVELERVGVTSSNYIKIGEKIKFIITLDELSTVTSSSFTFNFSVKNSSKKASCTSVSKANSFTCLYTVVSGDSFNINDIKSISIDNSSKGIKDIYGNSTSSYSSNVTASSTNYVVDGVAPTVTNIYISESGKYSDEKPLEVVVDFSEDLVRVSSASFPVLTIGFEGNSVTRECTISGNTAKRLIYSCEFKSNDVGTVKFVSFKSSVGFSDLAGNALSVNLTNSNQYDFSKAVVDSDLPFIKSTNVDYSGCSGNYCKNGDIIIINVLFEKTNNNPFSNKNSLVYFGGVSGKGSKSDEYDYASRKLSVTYRVSTNDNGLFLFSFSALLRGENGKTNNVESVIENISLYADNSNPVLENEKVYVNDEEISDSVLYVPAGETIEVKYNVEDYSDVVLDASKIYLVDDTGVRINVCSNCSIESITSVIEDKVLSVKVKLAQVNVISFFSVKIEKSAIVDSFSKPLDKAYTSKLLTVNSEKPKFSIEVSYPEYKGYKEDDGFVIISGNVVNFKIISSDIDLKSYCVKSDSSSVCSDFKDLVIGNTYEYTFTGTETNHEFYVVVRDSGNNTSEVKANFKTSVMFEYVNGKEASASHTINVNLGVLNANETFKYAWFKEGDKLSFSTANNGLKGDSNLFVMKGLASFNGNYKACIQMSSNQVILCSDYVVFDTKIDEFKVEYDKNWTNTSVNTNIIFNDISVVKCIAIGKGVTPTSCDYKENVTIIKNVSSPYSEYSIEENGIYYFYIEDMISNYKRVEVIVDNIDTTIVNIEVFNGNSEGYDSNLGLDGYKNNHKFKVTFDRNETTGSPVKIYKYFYSETLYTLSSELAFNTYYLNSSYKREGTLSNTQLTISDSLVNGIYNLYIMAKDTAGNVSFKVINSVKVDNEGPIIKMYDKSGNLSEGGSSTYVVNFDYDLVITDSDSNLDLNEIYYRWIDDNGNEIVRVNYDGCEYGVGTRDTCSISNRSISIPSNKFSASKTYYFELSVKDNASNISTFRSSSFKIDTMKPSITSDVSSLYTNSRLVEISVSKDNIGTLNTVGYCLNECENDKGYDTSKFNFLSLDNKTTITKSLYLSFNEGVNHLYVYADDVLGNYLYKEFEIKYDNSAPVIEFEGTVLDNVIDFSGVKDYTINYTVSDPTSGVKKQYIYNNEDSKQEYSSSNSSYVVSENGVYYFEVIDNAGNSKVYTITVKGIDSEQVSFDLVSSVLSGKFSNADVVIKIDNLRKNNVSDVSSVISNIDYVFVSSVSEEYGELFATNTVHKIYDVSVDNSFVNTFTVSSNGAYIVRIIDSSNNVSYKVINITCIDKDKPFINTDLDEGKDRIYARTSTGNNMQVEQKNSIKVYKYSNEAISIYFNKDSVRDLDTDYNNYLAIKLCFMENSECVYNTYEVNTSVSGSYLYNSKQLVVSTPYHFSGVVKYYVVDGANNESDKYSLEIVYVDQIKDINVSIKDKNNNSISESNKYNEVFVSFECDDTVTIKYTLAKTNINIYTEYLNRGSTSVSSFLNNKGFVNVSSLSDIRVSKSNVDDEYYLWVYVMDSFGNSNLFNVNEKINLDTIAPTFEEIGFSVDKREDSYYLVANSNEYMMYYGYSNDVITNRIVFENGEYEFANEGVYDTVYLKLEDSASNVTYTSFKFSEITSSPYIRVYQNNNERSVTIVIYNLGSKTVTLEYLVTNITNNKVFDDSSINSYDSCVYDEDICKDNKYSKVSTGVYRISLSEDKKVILYIRLDGVLIKDKNNKLVSIDLVVDKDAPVVEFSSSNASSISTSGVSTTFGVSVSDKNMSSNSAKYIFTKKSSISNFNNEYSSCVSSNNCIKGIFSISEGVVINGNDVAISNLDSGNYYLYVYAEDDYGNGIVSGVRSSVIYVDNSAPVIAYLSNSRYVEIENELFTGSATKLRFNDNNEFSYFEIYVETVLNVRCYVKTNDNDYNCVRNVQNIGFESDSNYVYYNLDSGSYTVIAYDLAGNSKNINVIVDGAAPIITLYKKDGETYAIQPNNLKIYNNLDDLYLKISDDNFSYMTIDLKNGSQMVSSAVRYSYTHEIGMCLSDPSVCEYGKNLRNILSDRSIVYSEIIVKAYDKSSRYSSLTIKYDDVVPEIWTKEVNEEFSVGNFVYKINTGMSIDVEIGVNTGLNIDSLLKGVILKIDDMSYDQVKSSSLFSLVIYDKFNNSVDYDIFDKIGTYRLVINYKDEAFNEANTKEIVVNVKDTVKPTLISLDTVEVVELNEVFTFRGISVSDNYLLSTGEKKETLKLTDYTSCFVNEVSCSSSNIINSSDNSYIISKTGEYNFTYRVSDFSGNISELVITIVVVHTKGPYFDGDTSAKNVYILNRKSDFSINVNNVTVNYPYSFDVGDNKAITVTYDGLYGVNSKDEKFVIDNDIYKISDNGSSIEYKFTVVGKYYLRFKSVDSGGNISYFDYEVNVIDEIKPSISGVNEGQVVTVDINSTVEDIKSAINASVSDNYDDSVDLIYDIVKDSVHEYRVIISAKDSSNNESVINVYVDIRDDIAPIVGELIIVNETNLNEIPFEIIGGSDNSNNFYHEYSADGVTWTKYENDSYIIVGSGFSRLVSVCIRAVDNSNNVSGQNCKDVLIDTKAPVISGVSDGEIVSKEITVNVSDDRLASVIIKKNGELLSVDKDSLPVILNEIGMYSVVAKDSLNNVSVINFAITDSTKMSVSSDVSDDNASITVIEFDARLLVKTTVSKDKNGETVITALMNNISVNNNDMIYILGRIPDTDNVFIMRSVTGSNFSNNSELVILEDGNHFGENHNDTDYLIEFGDSYYAYLVIKKNVTSNEVVRDVKEEDTSDNGLIKIILIALGAVLAFVIGYHIIKFRRRVRAA